MFILTHKKEKPILYNQVMEVLFPISTTYLWEARFCARFVLETRVPRFEKFALLVQGQRLHSKILFASV